MPDDIVKSTVTEIVWLLPVAAAGDKFQMPDDVKSTVTGIVGLLQAAAAGDKFQMPDDINR